MFHDLIISPSSAVSPAIRGANDPYPHEWITLFGIIIPPELSLENNAIKEGEGFRIE